MPLESAEASLTGVCGVCLCSEKAREAAGVPRADARFRVSTGRVCDQRHGKLDGDMARPAPESRRGGFVTVYPTPAQADEIAGLLRTRVRCTVSIGKGLRRA